MLFRGVKGGFPTIEPENTTSGRTPTEEKTRTDCLPVDFFAGLVEFVADRGKGTFSAGKGWKMRWKIMRYDAKPVE